MASTPGGQEVCEAPGGVCAPRGKEAQGSVEQWLAVAVIQEVGIPAPDSCSDSLYSDRSYMIHEIALQVRFRGS